MVNKLFLAGISFLGLHFDFLCLVCILPTAAMNGPCGPRKTLRSRIFSIHLMYVCAQATLLGFDHLCHDNAMHGLNQKLLNEMWTIGLSAVCDVPRGYENMLQGFFQNKLATERTVQYHSESRVSSISRLRLEAMYPVLQRCMKRDIV